MSLSVKFNDIQLNNLIDVEFGLNLFDGAEWQPELKSIQNVNGSDFLRSRYGAKTITMPFRIKGNIKEKFDNLQRFLNVSEPKKLIFGKTPNRYFMAIPSGSVGLIEEKNGYIARGTITWLVPDGVSTSTATSEVHAEVINDVLTVTVQNNGTAATFPTYRIKNDAENGYHGIVHAGGALEIGNKEETDGQDYQQTETFLDTTTFNETGWSNWSGTYTPDARFDLSGTLAVSGSAGQAGLRLTTTGGNTGLFNGAGKVYTLPADSEGNVGAKNFYAWWDTFFWAGKMGQTAVQDIIFWSGNEIIARWLVLKTDKNGNSAVCRASYFDGTKIQNIPKYDFTFKSSHLDTENPFNQSRGAMDFLKEGQKLQFHYWGKYYSVNVPYLENKEVTKMSIVLANYDKRSGTNYVTHNAVQRLQIRKLKVDKWRDVPNRYGAESEILIDTESANVYVNDLPANNELINGSVFAPLQPGENKIEFYNSSWADNQPEITVEYKERWL